MNTSAATVATPTLDTELLRRYDSAGPRYTSYPTAPQFNERFGEAELRAAIAASNEEPIPRRLSLYVHVPFCVNPCFYCGCNRVITHDRSRGDRYLRTLEKEIDLTSRLFDRDREVVQLHFGGGTPNFLSVEQLVDTAALLRRKFPFANTADRDISIELDPRYIAAEEIAVLADGGFDRASLGVQDFDPVVQSAVNRVQGVGMTREIVDACRASGFRSVNIDLIYGLPRQTPEGFGRTLDQVIDMRPDRLAVYSYAHMPHAIRAQRQIDAADLPDAEGKLALMQLAIRRLCAAGYQYIGMDHFALPDDELALAQQRGDLHRNFMGYTTHADTDLIGLGVTSISHIGDTYSQNARDVLAWQIAVDAERLPVFRGVRLDDDDQLRAALIQHLMCQGEIPVRALERRFRIVFDTYFADAIARLQPLRADGLVRIAPDRIAVTAAGRLLLRHVAMCFDRYLDRDGASTPARFSRAI